MSDEKKKPKGEFQIIEHQGKILTVYRKCSCGGDVEIKVDKKTGKKTATCKSCGNTLTWGGEEEK
jgi:transcription elongation factor Elf1